MAGAVRLEVRGRVFSGMGKGRYYVGHPEYQRRFKDLLGYAPYPGTLNVKLEEEATIRGLDGLRKKPGKRVNGFEFQGESFSALNCFDGILEGERVTLLFIEVTYYNESVAELISPVYLREKFGLKDGDSVDFTLEVP
jgi:riboflavin kinase, archaea type